MKKYLIVLFFFAIASGAHAQADLKVYSVPCIMPDGSLQQIILHTNDTGKKEFLRIASENIMNIKSISLRKKQVAPHSQMLMQLPIVSESDAYRFLANQFCENCSTVKSMSKTTGGSMVVQSPNGSIALIVMTWLPQSKKWYLMFLPNADPFADFTAKAPVFG